MRPYNEYDVLKVVATLLVVIGHVTIQYNETTYPEQSTTIAQSVTFLIYLFHMPLFMSLSGAIYELGYAKGKNRKFTSFVKSKIYRLLIPYLFVGSCLLVPVLYWLDQGDLTIGKLYGNILEGKDCRHLWYLLALFEIYLIHFGLKSFNVPDWVLLYLSIVVATVYSAFLQFDWLCVNMAIRYYPYFIFGTILAHHSNDRVILYGLIGSIVAVIGIYLFNNKEIDILLSIIFPLFIVAFIVQITRRIVDPKFLIKNRVFKLLLNDSYPIYLFHVMVIYIANTVLPIPWLWIKIPTIIVVSIILPIIMSSIIKRLHGHLLIGERSK